MIAEPVAATRLLRVRGIAGQPELAAQAANDVVHAYVRAAQADASTSTRRDIDALHADQADTRDALGALETEIAALQNTPAANLPITRRTAHEVARNTALVARDAAIYRQLAQATSLDGVAAIAQDPLVAALTSQLASLEALRDESAATHVAAERMAAIDAAIAATRRDRWAAQQRLAQDIRGDYQALASRGQVVRQQLASFQAAAENSRQRIDRASELFTRLAATRDRLSALNARERELTAALAGIDSGARIVAVAEVPASRPDVSRAALALLVAVVSLALSRLRTTRSRRFVRRPASAYSGFRTFPEQQQPTPVSSRRHRAA